MGHYARDCPEDDRRGNDVRVVPTAAPEPPPPEPPSLESLDDAKPREAEDARFDDAEHARRHGLARGRARGDARAGRAVAPGPRRVRGARVQVSGRRRRRERERERERERGGRSPAGRGRGPPPARSEGAEVEAPSTYVGGGRRRVHAFSQNSGLRS